MGVGREVYKLNAVLAVFPQCEVFINTLFAIVDEALFLFSLGACPLQMQSSLAGAVRAEHHLKCPACFGMFFLQRRDVMPWCRMLRISGIDLSLRYDGTLQVGRRD